MCGKFRAKKIWARLTDPLDAGRIEKEGGDPLACREEEAVTYRVMDNLPVIVWNRVSNSRVVVPMRWGFPAPGDWKKPQPIHARAETIDSTRAFAEAFADGQCGLVLMQNFNEAPDIAGPTRQHIITPDGPVLAAAVIWRRFDHDAMPFACCLVTVAANPLLAGLPTDRMPAFLAHEDWALWLGQTPAGAAARKACLRTTGNARWTMAPEQRREKSRRRKPGVRDPGGLF